MTLIVHFLAVLFHHIGRSQNKHLLDNCVCLSGTIIVLGRVYYQIFSVWLLTDVFVSETGVDSWMDGIMLAYYILNLLILIFVPAIAVLFEYL